MMGFTRRANLISYRRLFKIIKDFFILKILESFKGLEQSHELKNWHIHHVALYEDRDMGEEVLVFELWTGVCDQLYEMHGSSETSLLRTHLLQVI